MRLIASGKFSRFLLQLVGLFLLSACVATRVPIPVENYSHLTCKESIIPIPPSPPFCLSFFSSSDGFPHGDHFSACRQGVENYAGALEWWQQCQLSQADAVIAQMAAQIDKTLICFKRVKRNERGLCPTVQPAIVSVGEISFITPKCLSKPGQPTFPEITGTSCGEEAETFLDELEYGKDEQAKKMKRIAEGEFEDAIKKFNCIARRERVCI